MKAIGIAALLLLGVSAHSHLAAEEFDAKAISVVDRYVETHKHWKKADYRIKRDRTEDHCIVFLVTYLPEEKRPMIGGGETFEAYYDPAQGKVFKEMHFQ